MTRYAAEFFYESREDGAEHTETKTFTKTMHGAAGYGETYSCLWVAAAVLYWRRAVDRLFGFDNKDLTLIGSQVTGYQDDDWDDIDFEEMDRPGRSYLRVIK